VKGVGRLLEHLESSIVPLFALSILDARKIINST